MKNFHYRFHRSYGSSKVETWCTHGQWAVVSCIPESGLRAYNGVTSLDRFYKFSLMKKNCRTFLKNCKVTKLKPGTHMESGLMYPVYQNQGQGPLTHVVKSLDRFRVAMLPDRIWSYSDVSGKHELKKYFNILGISPLIALQLGYSQILWQLKLVQKRGKL